MKTFAAAAALALAAPVFAQDVPVPKMFQAMKGQKGQYRVEVLEGPRASKDKATAMTICTDNLLKPAATAAKSKPRAEQGCKHRLLKDTASEAQMESECPDFTSRVNLTREGEKSVLMSVITAGARGSHTMKMRYTHLGACREGQGMVTMDPNSEQCKKVRERAAKMDPAKQCAKQTDREACETKVRAAAKQLSAMCG